jgi:hypothetical protein
MPKRKRKRKTDTSRPRDTREQRAEMQQLRRLTCVRRVPNKKKDYKPES